MKPPPKPLTLLRIVAPRAVGGALVLGAWLVEIAPYFSKAMRRARPQTIAQVRDFAAGEGWEVEVVP